MEVEQFASGLDEADGAGEGGVVSEGGEDPEPERPPGTDGEVTTIPKRLRVYFPYDRALLSLQDTPFDLGSARASLAP